MVDSLFQFGNFVLLQGSLDDEIDNRNGNGQFMFYEGSFIDHETADHSGVFFSDGEGIPLNWILGYRGLSSVKGV